jgi:hypothetical protein
LLTNKKDAMRTSSRAGVRLEKIPDSALSKNNKSYSVDPHDRSRLDVTHAENDNASVKLGITFKNQKITR